MGALSYITEWQGINFSLSSAMPLELWLLIVLFAALSLGWQLPATCIAMLLFLLTMTLNHAWYGEYLGLITPLLLAPSLASQFDSQSTTQTVDCLISVLARTGAGSQQRLQYCSA